MARLLRDLVRTLLTPPKRRSDRNGDRRARPSARPADRQTPGRDDGDQGEESPGQFGRNATTEAHSVGEVHTSYNPSTDGDPDPGEIVWTWVPYEENDGRGKDRPVLVVAREPGGTLLAVQLTSKNHDGERDWVGVGSGRWDGEHRPSWVDISRVLRVHPDGMRREAAALGRDQFDLVIGALRDRYGWS
ncbi:type II toxin-antitoxin system PemK/MazF family toxin [Jiangella sp. DSM 45060]|uniref:type II toxin-antitoxin system PemK/MazF family toxin n=1 Tax=Jiangella sp. DSM 45060 TaxID=1798224 RepID=UPI001E43B207|nr:type II toxin-antitoxin system PemK/MazF family toxin [Jiangella sp. DSM 45060]